MHIRALFTAAALPLALALPAVANAAEAAPNRVLVRYDAGSTHHQRVAALRETGTGSAGSLPGGTRLVRIKDGDSPSRTAAELRAQPAVDYAVPDYRIHAAAVPFNPNDPGRGRAGDWRLLQWNFAGAFGVHARQAWGLARQAGVPGGKGVVVAVIDSGVAYRKKGRFRRAPDLTPGAFVSPYDFIDGDKYPLDEENHGTHVSGTIAQRTNNRLGVTGLAYGVKIMPLRVLDANGDGDGSTFARAIRFAVAHHAQVINMSVEFDQSLRAADIPEVISAIHYAHDHGLVMVGASGNDGVEQVSYPARDPDVISVGASTVHGCAASYSNGGTGLDLVAPGGGSDAALSGDPWDDAHCVADRSGRPIVQQTFPRRNPRRFKLVGFEGTSESAPHVTAIAALIIATGVIGAHPSPDAIAQRIESTARDIGPPGYDTSYGFGLADAAAAIGP